MKKPSRDERELAVRCSGRRRRKVTRRAAAGVAVFLASLMVSGCTADSGDGAGAGSGAGGKDGAGQHPDREDSASSASGPPKVVGKERPVAVTGPQKGLLDYDAARKAMPSKNNGPILGQVTRAIRQGVLVKAEVRGDTGATCEGGRIVLKPNETTLCTATYEGRSMPWGVSVSADYQPGSDLIEYDLSAFRALMTDKSVYNTFWVGFKGESDQLRCDRLPKASVIKLGGAAPRDTGYRCQYLGPLRDGVRRWVDVPLTVDSEGTALFRRDHRQPDAEGATRKGAPLR